MKTSTKERYYKCGHKVELADEENEEFCQCEGDNEEVYQNQEQIYASTKLRSLNKVINENEGAEEIILNEIPPDMAIDYLDEMGVSHDKQRGPIKVLIPIPDNEIEKGEELIYPAATLPVVEEEIIEIPPRIEYKEVRIVPENVDLLNIEGKLPEYPEPIIEQAPGDKLELEGNHGLRTPYQNQEIVNDPPLELKSQPIDFKDLRPDLSTKLNIKRPYRAPWNLVNEGVKTTKMFVKAPKKLTWNETNEKQNDEYIWEAPPKPDFEISKFDLPYHEGQRVFKDLKIDDEIPELPIPGREKILEVESMEPFPPIEGQEKRDWNRLCEPQNKENTLYKGIPKPAFQEQKPDELEYIGEPFTLNWNKVNEEDTPLSLTVPGKNQILEPERLERLDYPGIEKNWNHLNEQEKPENLYFEKQFIPKDFEMVIDNNFQLPDDDAIITNDDYNTCDNDISRPVHAIISKVNEEKEEDEEMGDIDVLAGITRIDGNNGNDGVLRSKKKNVYSTNVNVNSGNKRVRLERRGNQQEELRNIEFNKIEK